MEIKGEKGVYRIGNLAAEAEAYRLYLCSQVETGRQCLLQIANTEEQNGQLDRAAYLLGELARRAEELEEEYAKVKTNPKSVLNYNLGFPELVDSFVCPEQGGRRINVLAFRCVEEVGKMVPISNITEKDRLRVDPRTSAWMMGKALKLLAFAFSEGISVGLTTGKNLLIEPDKHYVLIFDWSGASTHPEVPKKTRCQEISQAAQAVITALGGDGPSGFIPNDGDEPFERFVNLRQKEIDGAESPDELRQQYQAEAFRQYADFLLDLARGAESDAERAHREFYELVDALWPREFYPFTTKL